MAESSPDPRASGPKRSSGQKVVQLFCSAGPNSSGLSYHPASPRLDTRKPCGAPSFLGARRGAEEAGKLFPRGTGRASPSARKAATCSRLLETFTHTSTAPSPLAGLARGPTSVATEHLPDTWRDASPPPPPPLRTPRGPATVPQGPGRAAAVSIPLTSLGGTVASTPTEAPLSTQPKRQRQIKKKLKKRR